MYHFGYLVKEKDKQHVAEEHIQKIDKNLFELKKNYNYDVEKLVNELDDSEDEDLGDHKFNQH